MLFVELELELELDEEHATIIALTASALVSDQQQCTDAAMGGFLSKPLQKTPLAKLFTRWARDNDQLSASAGQGLLLTRRGRTLDRALTAEPQWFGRYATFRSCRS